MSGDKPGSREWEEISDSREWDGLLSRLNGHPLQSALWGDARCKVDGIHDMRFACIENSDPIFMARVEERRIPLFGKVAWIPRGPTIADGINHTELEKEFAEMLRRKDFCLAIHDRYAALDAPIELNNPGQVKTIWIDLTQGQEELEKKLDNQWRYGFKRAAREGVLVRQSIEEKDVEVFFSMCQQISQNKKFDLPGSIALLAELLHGSSNREQSTALFVAYHHGEIAAGAMTARSGQHVHYLWGAADRKYSKQRAGEAVQWAVIQWAIKQGCSRYDLEGIDPVNNPGTYQFKKKMGGNEIALQGKCSIPLNWRGAAIHLAGRLTGRI